MKHIRVWGGVFLPVVMALGLSLSQGFSQSTNSCDAPPAGMIGWWQAEGTAFDVISGGTGTLFPGTSYAAGEVGEAFSFDGANGCVMNTNTPPYTNIQNNFTIEFWAYPQQGFTLPVQDTNGLYNAGQSFAVFPDWGGTSGQAGVGVCVGTNGIAVMEHAYNYLPSLLTCTNTFNGWIHVAVVYTNKQPSLYVNGAYVGTGLTSPRTFVYPSKNFGGSYDHPTPFTFQSYGPYKGLLDEISIYNRALSAGEIQAIYAAGSAGKCYAGAAPVVTTQPVNQSVAEGSNVTFSVTASGSPLLHYQWTFNGTNIAGATNVSLSLAGVLPANAGNYAVAITNLYGATVSSNATLTVITYPPAIVTQPVNLTVNATTTATFSVAAAGTPPLQYQWAFDGANISGATNNVLSLSDVQAQNAGSYAVVVSNPFGSVTSSNAVLTVDPAPPCDAPPAGMIGWWQAEGTALDVISGGTGRLYPGTSYAAGEVGEAFSFDGTNGCVMNTNTPALTYIQNNFTMEFWAYPQKRFTLPAQNTNGVYTSGQSFAIFPDWGGSGGQAGVGVCVGSNGISVMEHAAGYLSSLLTYTNTFNGWVHVAVVYTNKQPSLYVNGAYVGTGLTSPRTFVYPSKNFGGSYDTSSGYFLQPYGPYKGLLDEVSIYNRALSAGEIQAIYAAGSYGKCYAGTAPVVTTQPASQSVGLGSNVTFSVTASGSPLLHYQWTFNGANIAGATNLSLSLAGVLPANSGNYAVSITNLYGATVSSNATLTVITYPPAIVTQPTNVMVNATATATFSVTATGTLPLQYQWAFDGTNISGATNTVLSLPNAQPANDGSYAVIVSSAYGSVTSSIVTLTVLAYPPSIVTQPANVTVNVTATATFSVTASGTAPLQYQWTFNGTNLIGATSSVLSLPNAQPASDGSYAVTISNPYGVTNSASATLTVLAYPPSIVSQPTNETVNADSVATFSVAATGSPALTYQWTFDGTNISGATSNVLSLTDVQVQNAGGYEVVVSNPFGSVTSSNAVLAVNPPLPCDAPPSGLVDWWPANGNATDIIGGGTGTLYPDTSYAAGEVGGAFSFDGTNACVMNTDTPALTYIQNTFTIEFWAYPQKGFTLPVQDPGGLYNSGQSFAVFPDWGGYGGQAGVGVCVGTNGISVMEHAYNYLPSLLTYTNTFNGWVHVAVVYTNKQPSLYVNGAYVATGITSPRTFVYPSKNFGGSYDTSSGYFLQPYGPYKGFLDEISIYNRALSAGEIQAIYAAGAGGKCTPPVIPVVTLQPTNETVAVNGSVTFNAAAEGLPPLNYQWTFDGTNIAGATNASLTLTDVSAAAAGTYQFAVMNGNGLTFSSNAVLTVGLPASITLQPASQTVLSYNSAIFTVAASGVGPFTYQWQKNGVNLTDGGNVSGSATASLTLATVTESDAANYDVLVGNPFGTTNSAAAVLTVPQSVAILGTGTAMSGGTLIVPVLMSAVGNENSFLGSVGYDPTKLVLQSVQPGTNATSAYVQEVDTATNSGYVGFAILFDYGTVVPAGTQQLAQLVFQVLPVTNTTVTALTFGGNPTPEQLVDNNLDSLPFVNQNSTVTLLPAEYEADVYPRFSGDHVVNLQDWLEVGRMVAGLDVPTNSDEFLRADCAPRNAPDGVLTVADWVQAGRYALGLDPLTLVPAAPGSEIRFQPRGGTSTTRTLQVSTAAGLRGQPVNVPVLLICTTNENAAGMTIGFNPALLKLTGITLGSSMPGGRMNINTNTPGKCGVVVALPPGQTLAAGTNQIVVLQFTCGTNALNTLPLTLDGSVVTLQLADKSAGVLPANYANGAVVLPSAPAVQALKQGSSLQLSWPVSAGSWQVLTANSPLGPWQPVGAAIVTNGNSATVTVTATNHQQYYQLQGQ